MDFKTVNQVIEAKTNNAPFSIVTTEDTIVVGCDDLRTYNLENLEVITKVNIKPEPYSMKPMSNNRVISPLPDGTVYVHQSPDL